MQIKNVVGFIVTLLLVPLWLSTIAYANNHTEKLIAIVNGVDVKQFEYDIAELTLAAELTNLPKLQRQQIILQFLIDLKLMSAAARKDGFDKRVDYQQKMSFFAEQTLNNLYYSKKILEPIDNAALQLYYEEQIAQIKPATEMRARHILLKDEEAGNTVLELLDNGEDFIEMAEKHSIDPTRTQGGDLGFFSEGDVDAVFAQALSTLEVGEFTKKLVKTKFGYHIIKLEEKRKKPLPTFEKVKTNLLESMVSKKADALAASLRQNAEIELFIELDDEEQDAKPTESIEKK